MLFDRNVFLKAPSQLVAGEADFIGVDVDKRTIVTATRVSISPARGIASPVDYLELGSGVVEVRLATSQVWITHECRKEENGLWWTIMGKDYFWEYVTEEEVPAWAHEVILSGRAQLEKRTG